jgi:HPt (histidine-containing phosphotransfer) domain-containing protein
VVASPLKPQTEIEIDEDLYDLVPGFVESRHKDIRQIEELLKNRDFSSIAKMGHTIKGIARPYGFPTLEVLAKKMETAAKASDLSACNEVLGDIQLFFSKY